MKANQNRRPDWMTEFEWMLQQQGGLCKSCQAKHGERKKTGVVILTINRVGEGKFLFCQECAFRFIKAYNEAPVHGTYNTAQKKYEEDVKAFGLEQERLI